MKKIIITTGGTGGHIYPALAVGKELENRGMEVIFVGSKFRMEKDIVPKEGFRFIGLPVYPFSHIKKIYYNLKSFIKAFGIIIKEKPDIVIGFGNYISIPILFASTIMRKKIYLQEQNADLGLANKLFYKFSKKCFLAFDMTYEEIAIKDQTKFLVVGNPLREDIYEVNKELERKKLKIGKNEKVLLVTGGSLGAKSINEAMLKNLKEIFKNKDLRLYWATGEKNFNEINERLKDSQIKMSDIIKPYFNNIINIMAAADLVVARAGALTISELIELEKPSILIPYNSIKVGQYKNAKILFENEAALVYSDNKAELAIEKALEIIINDEELYKMSRRAKNLKKEKTTEKIIENLDVWRN